MISAILRWKVVHSVVILAFLAFSIQVVAFAGDDEDTYVTNVRVERQAKINVFIEFDLEGSADDLYTVSLTIKSKVDSAYSYTPINVIGDVGANIRPGKNKRISWRTSDEYPAVLATPNVEFVVKAVPPPTQGASTELFIAGGAAVVGVALAIVLLSSNKADPTQTNNEFPQPPGRPR